ncbi:nuclease-related domain-containing protein [Paraliobacillus zengyii]|uniref:nuclease-related domain-containing protein n=1 Tax=Paraliobacillus zengyii TaxID=2213194 RepID=UPI000E3CB6D4|nr:nuclease-related domain-containing protein [Paraliobacillus zengyii]
MFQQLEHIYGKYASGFYGESSLAYPFQLLQLKYAFILYDLRLPCVSDYFQIDALLLTPRLGIIIEAKNFKGEITLNQSDQLIRTLGGEKSSYKNPLHQAAIQKRHLERYIMRNGFHSIPIHTLVSFTHPNVILQFNQREPDIVDNHHLSLRIDELLHQYQVNYYTKEQLKKLANKLKNNHTPKTYNVIEKYQINRSNIRNGVWCPVCKKVIMNRAHGYWICPACKVKNREAHIQALKEYALLFGSTINNRQAKAFLQLKSSHVVKRLLANMKLSYVGKTKGIVYSLLSLLDD